MWWLVPVGVGIGIKLIYDAVSDAERSARQRWETKRAEVEKSVEEHRRNIEAHIAKAQSSYDFHFLVDLHFSSMKVADSAYSLLRDADSSFNGINKMLKKAKERKIELQQSLDAARQNKNNRKEIQDFIEQLKMVNEIRKSAFDDRDKVRQQKDGFLAEVKRLNLQTMRLKEFVRDRCGLKGKDWFNRLEARKAARRKAEGRVNGNMNSRLPRGVFSL